MKKKMIAIIMVAVLALMAFGCTTNTQQPDTAAPDTGSSSGSSSTEAPAGEQITLNFWHQAGEGTTDRMVIDKFVMEYMAQNPNVNIPEPHVLTDQAYTDAVDMNFTGDAANIDVFSYWGAGRGGSLYEAGKMLCIEDYLSADQLAMIKPGTDTYMRYGGKLYGAPVTSWMMVLYCNEELFKEHGAKLPETYDDLLAAAKIFNDAGIVPVALGGGVDASWQAAFAFEALACRIVGNKANNILLDTKTGFVGNDAYREVATKMQELVTNNVFGKNPLEIDYDTANSQFLEGVAAMRLTGSWFTGDIENPDESKVIGMVVPMGIPTVSGGAGLASDCVGGILDGYFVNANTAHPEVAADFAFKLSLALAKAQHEAGEGFSPYVQDIDDSALTPLGQKMSVLAQTTSDSILAWDTVLSNDDKRWHTDPCQALLKPGADYDALVSEFWSKIFS